MEEETEEGRKCWRKNEGRKRGKEKRGNGVKEGRGGKVFEKKKRGGSEGGRRGEMEEEVREERRK